MSAQPLPLTRQRVPRQTQPFLRGPVPLDWLRRAKKLTKPALVAGLVVWYVRGCSGKENVSPRRGQWKRFGVSRDEARRGIHALCDAGLLHLVKGGRGRRPVVRIVDLPPPAPPQPAAEDVDEAHVPHLPAEDCVEPGDEF